jgi:hypothetical protein
VVLEVKTQNQTGGLCLASPLNAALQLLHPTLELKLPTNHTANTQINGHKNGRHTRAYRVFGPYDGRLLEWHIQGSAVTAGAHRREGQSRDGAQSAGAGPGLGACLDVICRVGAHTVQHGVNMNTGLTTFDGFPRADIDVPQSTRHHA